MIKKTVGLSLFIFWAVTVSMLTSGMLFYANSQKMPAAGNAVKLSFEPTNTSSPVNNDMGTTTAQGLAMQEIGKHNSQSDCWLIISNKVYDVTAYIPYHPGGPETIVPYCGKDATAAFSGHSSKARNMLDAYYIGDVGQAITQPTNTQANNQINNNQTRTGMPNNTKPIFTTNVSDSNTNVQQGTVLSSEEVARHNTQSSCWMIISNKVYDVTAYIPYHPGGPATIIIYCGKDATVAFSGHSSRAVDLLNSYYIGDLGQLPSIQPVINNTQPINTQPPNNTQPLLNNTPPAITQPPNNTQPALNNTPPSAALPPNNNTNGQNITYISLLEVSGHSSASSCWMIVNNKVYDVTAYIPYHPGGQASIISYCGKDATIAFSGHSSNAQAMLSSYYIGELGQPPITTQPPASNPPANDTQPPNTQPPVINPPSDEEEEDD